MKKKAERTEEVVKKKDKEEKLCSFNFWDEISWNIHRIQTNIRAFFERIVGTIVYAAFVWKSCCYREWDYAYLYDLIEFKLKRMEKQLRSDNFVAESENTANNIKKALGLLDIYKNIEDGDYSRANGDIIKDMYAKEQEAWVKFHDLLRDEAQRWWS